MQNKFLLVWLVLGLGALALGMLLTIPVASASPVQVPPAQATASPTPEATIAATPAVTATVPAGTPPVAPTTTPAGSGDYIYWVIGGAVLVVAAVGFAIWYSGRR